MLLLFSLLIGVSSATIHLADHQSSEQVHAVLLPVRMLSHVLMTALALWILSVAQPIRVDQLATARKVETTV